jgi:hypothetical protein
MSVCRFRVHVLASAIQRPHVSVMLGSGASDRLGRVQENLKGDIYKYVQHSR